MSAVSGGGNYISDAAIMAWLANQQDGIYGDLRASMDLAEKRAAFNDELTTLKAQLADANEQGEFGKVDEQLQAFMDQYGSDPDFAKVCEGLGDMANTIHDDNAYAQEYKTAKAEQDKADAAAEAEAANSGTDPVYDPRLEEPTTSYSKETIEKWTKLIDDKVDTSGKNDQLTMIHIQELKATLDQGSQLASTFISSGDKTSSSIIGNIA